MNHDMKSMVRSWHAKLEQNIKSATKARDNAKDKLQKVMLAGKVKAYVQMACYLSDKYGDSVPEIKRP